MDRPRWQLDSEERDLLLRQALEARDARAVGDVLASYLEQLSGFVEHLRPDRDLTPPDVLQETYLRAERSIWRFDFERRPSPSAYLRAVARHVVQQGRARRRSSVPLDEHGEPAASPESDPLTSLMRSEMEVHLAHELSRLPPRYRCVLLLRAEGLGPAEIARRIGKGAAATRILIHRARRAAKELLAPWVAEGLP